MKQHAAEEAEKAAEADKAAKRELANAKLLKKANDRKAKQLAEKAKRDRVTAEQEATRRELEQAKAALEESAKQLEEATTAQAETAEARTAAKDNSESVIRKAEVDPAEELNAKLTDLANNKPMLHEFALLGKSEDFDPVIEAVTKPEPEEDTGVKLRRRVETMLSNLSMVTSAYASLPVNELTEQSKLRIRQAREKFISATEKVDL